MHMVLRWTQRGRFWVRMEFAPRGALEAGRPLIAGCCNQGHPRSLVCFLKSRLGFDHQKGGQIETETLSNRSKPKRSLDKKPGPKWDSSPEDRNSIEAEMPNRVEVESIEPRPTPKLRPISLPTLWISEGLTPA